MKRIKLKHDLYFLPDVSAGAYSIQDIEERIMNAKIDRGAVFVQIDDDQYVEEGDHEDNNWFFDHFMIEKHFEILPGQGTD